MSTPTATEAEPKSATTPVDGALPVKLEERAPSELRTEELTGARIIGYTGLGMILVSALVLFLNYRTNTPGTAIVVPPVWGWAGLALGISLMLYHSLRDGEREVRTIYLLVGGVLSLVGLVGLVVSLRLEFFSGAANATPSAGKFWAKLIMTLGNGIGIPFLLTAGRHETDPKLRRALTYAMFSIGAVMALAGLSISQFNERFLFSLGIILSLLGLAYLWALAMLTGTESDTGTMVARFIALVGGLVVLYALGRSIIPYTLYNLGWLYVEPAAYFTTVGLIILALGMLYLVIGIGAVSETPIVVLTRRELVSFFYSPIVYFVLVVMTVNGWAWYITSLVPVITESMARGLPINEPIVGNLATLLPVLALIVVIPAITMRTLSEEQRTATLEMLLTAPVTEWQVVVSKFLATLLVFLVLCIPWALYLLSLRIEGGTPFDYRPLLSFGLALISTGGAFIAMGIFFSSLTRDQIVSFALTAMGIVTALAIIFIQQFPGISPRLQTILQRFSFVSFWFDSMTGKVMLRDMVVYFSIAIFFMFLTTKVLESRRWR
jgi:ABC-2 type transport system permease protein